MSRKASCNGKGFEGAFALQTQKQINEFLNIPVTILENSPTNTGLERFNSLSPGIQDEMLSDAEQGVKKILESELIKNPHIKKAKYATVRLMPDQVGTTGDVTDVEISFSNKCVVCVSLKYHDDAIKHQRIISDNNFVRPWFRETADVKIEHQLQMGEIKRNIEKKTVERWGQLSPYDKLMQLYQVNTLVIKSLKNLTYVGTSEDSAKQLFRFLVGIRNYYKLSVEPRGKCVTLEYFDVEKLVDSVTAISNVCNVPHRYDTISVGFNNGWCFHLRLHNAESSFAWNFKYSVTIASADDNVTVCGIWKAAA
jgi:hypothetical protein